MKNRWEFFKVSKIYVPSTGPEAWKQFLAEPEKQWKTGYSARTLAHAWEAAQGLPEEVLNLFSSHPEFGAVEAELLLAIPEHKVPLPGGSTESQNDVFALVRIGERTLSVAVEGKVDEPFGPVVGEWFSNASDGKRERMTFLCETLGLAEPVPGNIYYQLLHRTASAVIEAQRFKTDVAVMVVHSFSTDRKWFDVFAEFVKLYGLTVKVGELVEAQIPSGIPLFLGWACGDPRFLKS